MTVELLQSINVDQSFSENRENLDKLGGIDVLAKALNLDYTKGLSMEQVLVSREKYGGNEFPRSPMESYLSLLIGALSDTTLLILLAAAVVSLIIGIIEEGSQSGWIEGTAILIAVFLVSNITAGNDYSKQLQFRALESTSAEDERCSVFRQGIISRINPAELVVGDILVLQAGDQIPADCIIFDSYTVVSNEASLTGESDDKKKSRDKDCFLLSSCLITEGEEVRAFVISVGIRSQWGKIKANLVTESVNTPLQDKLEDMTVLVGYIGMAAALAVFVVDVINIWARHNGQNIASGFIQAIILAVTIVVVAIPEGLPLAVTISLAFSTSKMYKDQCFIRVLAACETMGNATSICSDKTGTLTENRMTVVEGWFGDFVFDQVDFLSASQKIPENIRDVIIEQCSINRIAHVIDFDVLGKKLDRSMIIGNKTESALILMIQSWGFDYQRVRSFIFKEESDRVYAFNSSKKRSSAIVFRKDGSIRMFCKGASEILLNDCSMFMNSNGSPSPMTPTKYSDLLSHINHMAERSLRTLLLAHKDFKNIYDLPEDWAENPPDVKDLCCDCIVGIMDPLRPDVKEAVHLAQQAGVFVRMVTGDNLATASAIAKQCGILTPDGITLEGPIFRKMTPQELDDVLPKLQVLARSSPEDKFLLVTRLNGHAIPATKEEWLEKFQDRVGVTWETHRNLLLPGCREEWEVTRPEGGQVVGVTGDGTNDAPALKAADVGLSMGITGSKVAQAASDIVILDDRFSSIVRSILWGRAVYDNIRKFLQFQLTVNIVALLIVLIGAIADVPSPLNAVQMLWVNLIMDTLGALALGTESPTPELLQRKPYKRTSSLVSRIMWRNIIVMALYQLVLLLVLMFAGAELFNIIPGIACNKYSILSNNDYWDIQNGLQYSNKSLIPIGANVLTCNDFSSYCSGNYNNEYCVLGSHGFINSPSTSFSFNDLNNYVDTCLQCSQYDYTHQTIIFNTFIFCQIFNEYTSRSITNDWNVFRGLGSNIPFLTVSIFSVGIQIFLINVGGEFVKTTPLNIYQWLITIGLGFFSMFIGIIMRFIPIEEDPDSFFDSKDLGLSFNKHDGDMKKLNLL